MPYLIMRHILRSQYSEYSRQRLRLFLMDLLYDRSRVIRAYTGRVYHRRHFWIDHDAGAAAVFANSVNGGAWVYRSVPDAFLHIFPAPSGQIAYELRPVGRDEVFGTYIVGIFAVAENFFHDIDAEHVLAHSES